MGDGACHDKPSQEEGGREETQICLLDSQLLLREQAEIIAKKSVFLLSSPPPC